MKKLISGVFDFHRWLAAERDEVYEPLAEGQSPTIRFFACADSRVVPAFIARGWSFDMRAARVEVWSAPQQRCVPFEAYLEGSSS